MSLRKKALSAIGFAFISVGIVFNQWVVARIFSPDGKIERLGIKAGMWIFDFILILIGSFLLKYKTEAPAVLRERLARLFKTNKIVVVSVFSIYLIIFLEVASRILIAPDFLFLKIAEGHYGSYSSATWRHLWIKSRSKSEMLHNIYDAYDPTKGWVLKPNIKDMKMSDGTVINSNSKGIRGKSEYSYDKTPGKTRILILGDSFTFGDEVNDDETYPYCLQKLLPDTEVINFGVTGYGHDQMLIYLGEEGIKYSPDIIILGFMHGDVYRNLLEFREYSKPRFVLIGNRLTLRNSPVLPPEENLKKEFYRSKFIDLLSIIYHKIVWKVGLIDKRTEKITAAIFDEMIDVAGKIGAKCVFVYLPARDEVTQEEISKGEKFLSKYCKTKSLDYVSLRPYFLVYARNGIGLKARGGHYNTKGNLVAAEALKEYLVNNDLIHNK